MGFTAAIANTVDSVATLLLSALKGHINDYCDMETTVDDSIVFKDASMATIVSYKGFRSLLGKADFDRLVNDLGDNLEHFFSGRGHRMQAVFMRDDDSIDDIMRRLQPMYEAAETMQMDITDILDEKRDVHRVLCMDERVYFVLWTRPSLLDPTEVHIAREEVREFLSRNPMPGLRSAQDVTRPNRFLVDRHESFVSKVIEILTQLKCSVERVPIHQALCDQKRFLYRTTPPNWRPVLRGDPVLVRWKNNTKTGDASELMYPRLDDQLFNCGANLGNKKNEGGISDTKAVRIGDRIFAPVVMKLGPNRPKPFSDLFRSMNRATVKNDDGSESQIPWAITYDVCGDGLTSLQLRKVFATLIGRLSQHNRRFADAVRSLERYRDGSNQSVAKLQVTMMTWAGYGEERKLMMRRSKMVRAFEGWGNIVPEEERGDGLDVLLGAVPGLRLENPAPEAAPPLHDALYMFPLTRPASPFSGGWTIFRSLDGKALNFEIFSPDQATWITLAFGGPGSGKSVTMNRLNLEMSLMPGAMRLPYIGIIDIGVSSSGYTALVQDSLPDHLKHLVVYKRLQNRESDGINQFDTELGMRFPIPRAREAMVNFLVELATPATRKKAHAFMHEFAGRVIDVAFRKCADKDDRAQPKKYVPNIDPLVTKAVNDAAIECSEATTWWEVVDALFDKGLIYEASVAQRYAVPDLSTMLAAASDRNLESEFAPAQDNGMNVIEEFKLMVSAAMADYPICKGITRFDVRESRIMALDLQDVVPQGTEGAKKKAALMYMVALNCIMRKISIIKEDLEDENMPSRYRKYHARRVDELAEDKKRLFVDEYHRTGDNPNLRESFLIYGRESRKWVLEIMLASQLPEDFRELASIATTILIMDQGNETTRKTITEVFGLTGVEVAALKAYVSGPVPGVGATFLGKIKTKEGDMSQLFTASSGGIELWALSTTGEDRRLRSLLYDAMPGRAARAVLKKAFPGGTCRQYVRAETEKSKHERGEGFLKEDAEASIIEELAKKLIAEWKHDAAARSALTC
ncbi:IcmB protein [Pandoraea sp. ISTKB]|uniref:IcmB protein n=1 Tax=Pandoraea sp. ISTKB TaxID=1586708 RepID=UPI0009F2A527|nr:IcmB protein [Pandoraea sp. ISTKB]